MSQPTEARVSTCESSDHTRGMRDIDWRLWRTTASSARRSNLTPGNSRVIQVSKP
jgi:hypothetical protein